jgi:hypothetical protein
VGVIKATSVSIDECGLVITDTQGRLWQSVRGDDWVQITLPEEPDTKVLISNGAQKKFDPREFADQYVKTTGATINLEMWGKWCDYRQHEKRVPLTAGAAKRSLNTMAKHNFDEQAVGIEQSMEGQYQKLVIRSKANATGRGASTSELANPNAEF